MGVSIWGEEYSYEMSMFFVVHKLMNRGIAMVEGNELKIFKIDNNVKLLVLNIKENNQELTNYVNKHLVEICEGNSGSRLTTVKEELLVFLDRKKKTGTRMGAVAEFFVHLVLKTQDFKQDCLFLNLEENSIKKGFDGYYSHDSEEWIMESKSGMITTSGISHPMKIKEAYDDLDGKLAGNSSNNPWKNAYNHASHIDVGTEETIRHHIKKMSDSYFENVYANIKDFNIIPASTIFLDNHWDEVDLNELKDEIKTHIKGFKYTKLNIVCITKKSVEILQDILRAK